MIVLLAAGLSAAAPVDFAGCRGDPVQVAVERFEDMLVSGSPSAEVAFADCLARMGLWHSAQRHYLEVVHYGPDTAGFPDALGRAFAIAEEIGDLHSLAHYLTGLGIPDFPARPGRDALLFVHGRNLLVTGHPVLAAGAFEEISDDFAYRGQVALAHGRTLEVVGEYRQAVDVYRQVVDGVEADEAREREGLLLAKFGEPGKALTALEDIGADSPRKAAALAAVARLWLRLGQDEQARQAANASATLAKRAGHLPTAELVLAEIDVRDCRFGRANRRLNRFEDVWKQTAMALDAVSWVGNPSGTDAWASWLGSDPVDMGIPRGVLAQMRQDAPERRFLASHLDQLYQELEQISGVDHPAFQEIVAPHLERVVYDGRGQLRYLLGESFLAQMRATSGQFRADMSTVAALRQELSHCDDS